MANEEQVERLKRSVDEWNKWRVLKWPETYKIGNIVATSAEEPDLRPADLSGADLSKTNLNHAILSKADLHEANLSEAYLYRAYLKEADLRWANLSRARLRAANLIQANLGMADLSEAKLQEAHLQGANLDFANCTGANFNEAILHATGLSLTNCTGTDFAGAILHFATFKQARLSGAILYSARFRETLFINVDLSSIKELENAIHDGPSTVDITSVTLPHDEPTRLHFLRGVGFTETQIDYLPSLLTPRPIEYSSLFISYAHQDEVIAKRLYTDLRKKDVPCWFAPHDLRPGTLIVRGVEEAIHQQDKLLLILSQHAVNSNWVRYEVETALDKQATSGRETLFPIRLDNTILESNTQWAKRLRKHHIGDFTCWQDNAAYQRAFTTLLQHLKVTQPPTNRSAS